MEKKNKFNATVMHPRPGNKGYVIEPGKFPSGYKLLVLQGTVSLV